VPLADECPAVGIPRVTALQIDPLDPETIWLGAERDGMRCSRDGGDTWQKLRREFSEIRSLMWMPA
jgi:hypothetical protein